MTPSEKVLITAIDAALQSLKDGHICKAVLSLREGKAKARNMRERK